jgi:hypothetical protein
VKELEHELEEELRKSESVGEARSGEVGRLQIHRRRLQVHREVFKRIISNFHAYRPLLSAVMNEYDGMISTLQDQLTELRPLQIRVGTFDQESGVRMMEVADKHEENVKEKDRRVKRLLVEINEMRETGTALQTQTDRLRDEVSALNEKYRHEQAAKMMLLSQTNELMQYKREMDLKVQQMDPGKAYTAERLQKKLVTDLEDAREAVEDMKRKYATVVPLQTHTELQAKFKLSEAELIRVTAELADTTSCNAELTSAYNVSQIEYKHLDARLDSWTPRPQWSAIEDTFEGWKETTRNVSSVDQLKFLMEQVNKSSHNAHKMSPGKK